MVQRPHSTAYNHKHEVPIAFDGSPREDRRCARGNGWGMKFDSYGALVREAPRPPGHEIANLGDSCADTCRLFIVGGQIPNSELPDWPVQRFRDPNWKGWLRHPDLYALPGKEDWGTKGFTNDQLVPLLMAQYLDSNLLRFSLVRLLSRYGSRRLTFTCCLNARD